jgi:hypothetical protein
VIFGALQVTKVLSTEEVKRAIEGSGKDFGKSKYTQYYKKYLLSRTNGQFLKAKISIKFYILPKI